MTASLPNLATANNNPTVVNSGDTSSVGAPTISNNARGLLPNTSIALSNSNIAHVCDISGSLKYSIAFASLQVKQLVELIRSTIASLFASTSSSPFGDGVRNVATAIKQALNQINKLVAKAKEVAGVIQGYIVQLKQLLVYIASLPARIATALKQCLSDATASIKDAISNAQAIVNSQSGGLLSTASSNSANTTAALAAAQSATPASSGGNSMSLT